MPQNLEGHLYIPGLKDSAAWCNVCGAHCGGTGPLCSCCAPGSQPAENGDQDEAQSEDQGGETPTAGPEPEVTPGSSRSGYWRGRKPGR